MESICEDSDIKHKKKCGFAAKTSCHPSIGRTTADQRKAAYNARRAQKYANKKLEKITQVYPLNSSSILVNQDPFRVPTSRLSLPPLFPETDSSKPMDVETEIDSILSKEVPALNNSISSSRRQFGTRSQSYADSSDRVKAGITDNVADDIRDILISAYPGKMGENETFDNVVNSIYSEVVPKLKKKLTSLHIHLDPSNLNSSDSSFKDLKKNYLIAIKTGDNKVAFQILSLLVSTYYTSCGGNYTAETIQKELNLSYEMINKALKHISSNFPGASVEKNNTQIFRERISNDTITHLARFLCSPSVSRSAEANKENLADYERGSLDDFKTSPIPGINMYHLWKKEFDEQGNIKGLNFRKVSSIGSGLIVPIDYLRSLGYPKGMPYQEENQFLLNF